MNLAIQVGIVLSLAALSASQNLNDCIVGAFGFDASEVGTIHSPFFGEKNYGNSLSCNYVIVAPEGYRIKLTFKELDISPSNDCVQDHLTVQREDRKTDLGKFCGSEIPNPILSHEGDTKMWLRFNTDSLGTGKGFKVQFESSPYFTSVCDDDQTQCANRNCFNEDDKCDGVDDCGDGTDEEDCGFPIETYPEKCGKQEIEPNTIFKKQAIDFDRMVGGEEAIPNSWPWQVSLHNVLTEPNGHFCGGTLINAQWVLTATHCVAGSALPGEIRIHLGAHNKFKKNKYEMTRKSKLVVAYPDMVGDKVYKQMEEVDFHHDLSLIKLNAPVKFSKGVQPACLPSKDWKTQIGWNCYVTGWGLTRGTGGADVLKQQLQVVRTGNYCVQNFQTQICVKQDRQSPCSGDSGGPLQCRVDEAWYVFGVASYVIPQNMKTGLCTGPDAMTIYGSVAEKAEWIKTTINKYS